MLNYIINITIVQKTSKNASILIWSIFLSLMISIAFLNINTKITKNLKENSQNNKNITQQNNIKSTMQDMNWSRTIVWINSIYIENTILNKSLKKDEEYEIIFNINSFVNIKMLNAWVMQYDLNWTINDKWVINKDISNFETWSWILKLINLSWITSFELVSDNKFEIPEKKYKILERIWNKDVIKTRGITK